MSWANGLLVGFDLETSGTNVESDRIVTAAVVELAADAETVEHTWLSDVDGVEIPAGAADIHGITTEHAREHGTAAALVVDEVVTRLAELAALPAPLVIMNASYDLTMLDREARRHGVTPLTDRVPYLAVIDPMVIDRQLDRYRRGSRTLTSLARHYRVTLDDAHQASADAVATCRVAWRMTRAFPGLGALPLDELHAQQQRWARELADDRAAYFARTPGKEHLAAGVRREWPLVPFGSGGAS